MAIEVMTKLNLGLALVLYSSISATIMHTAETVISYLKVDKMPSMSSRGRVQMVAKRNVKAATV
jgi:hypothetical protein